MRKKDKPSVRRILNNLCKYSALKEVKHNSDPLSMDSTQRLPPKEQYMKQRWVKLTPQGKRNLGNSNYSSQVIKVNINSDNSC